RLELREQKYDQAIATIQPLVSRAATRSEALLRIARIQHKAGQPQAALDTYQRLASDAEFNPSGAPYALLAATARCRILTELRRQTEALREAESLRNSLLEGRWRISREIFEYHWAELDLLGIHPGKPPQA